jgi:hypothetical protein
VESIASILESCLRLLLEEDRILSEILERNDDFDDADESSCDALPAVA